MRISIRIKLSLFITIIIFVIITAIYYVVIPRIKDKMTQEREERGKTLARFLASNSEEAIVAEDDLYLAKMVSYIGRESGVKYAMIVSSMDTTILAHSQKTSIIGEKFVEFKGVHHPSIVSKDSVHISKFNLSSKEVLYDVKKDEIGEEVLDIIAPIIIQYEGKKDKIIGYAKVGVSSDEIRRAVDDIFRWIIIFFTILLVLAIVLAVLFASVFIRPIKRLVEGAHKVGEGNLDIEIEGKSNDEIGDLTLEFNKMVKGLKEKERIKAELEAKQLELKIAGDIQMKLLPKENPVMECLDICGKLVPAKEVGGDYYDFIQRKDNELDIIIGDVSGKGVPAGLIMVMIRTIVHSSVIPSVSPRDILLNINRFIFDNTEEDKFVTMLYLRWNEDEKKITYSAGGHEHILVYRASQKICERIPSGGIAIGVDPFIDEIIEENQIHLDVDDAIVLYTDGVTEAKSKNGELFGLDNIVETIEKHGDKFANEILEEIYKKVADFTIGEKQSDDITIIVLKRRM